MHQSLLLKKPGKRPLNLFSGSWWKRWENHPVVRWGPFLVPVVYLAWILCLQPPDLLGNPWPQVYDDSDPAAMALRGLNATLGRSPGRVDEPADAESPATFAHDLDRAVPLQPRYFLEYPHAALLLFRLPYVFQSSVRDLEIPPALLDCRHPDLMDHEPRRSRFRPEFVGTLAFAPHTSFPGSLACAPLVLSSQDDKLYAPDKEQALWRHFRRAAQTYQVFMIVCLLALMAVLRRGYQPGRHLAGPIALLLLPAALYFTANRFDVVPALLMALSLACLGRRQVAASAILLGAATMVKVYPVLVVPVVLRYLSNNRKETFTWTAAYGATVAAFLLPPLWQFGWVGTVGPYLFQLSRPPVPFATLYGVVLPRWLAAPGLPGQLFRLGSVLFAGIGLAVHRPTDLAGLLRRAAVVLIVFVALQVFYSPQWILWLSPLLLPLCRRHWPLIPLVIALDVVTYLTFPVVCLWDMGPMVWARCVILGLMVMLLLWAEFANKRATGLSWKLALSPAH